MLLCHTVFRCFSVVFSVLPRSLSIAFACFLLDKSPGIIYLLGLLLSIIRLTYPKTGYVNTPLLGHFNLNQSNLDSECPVSPKLILFLSTLEIGSVLFPRACAKTLANSKKNSFPCVPSLFRGVFRGLL